MTSLNCDENRLCDLYLAEYVSKNMELKIITNILNVNYDILQRNKIALKDKYKKLDNVNYNVWAIEDQFCSQIWNFSLEHNFSVPFNHYPNITEVIKSHNCKYHIGIHNVIENIDVHQENMLTQLKNEIDIINNEITVIRNKNIKQDIRNATIILDNLRSFSEEILNLIRSINTLENSQNICNVPMYQQSRRVTEGFMSANKLIKKSNIHSAVLIEKEVTSPSRTIAGSKKFGNLNGNIKFGKFIMKKQSVVSLKFEQNLRH